MVKLRRGDNIVVERKRVVCCGRTGTEGLEALIKFRTQSPCFKEKERSRQRARHHKKQTRGKTEESNRS
jgi:hypothetical protein